MKRRDFPESVAGCGRTGSVETLIAGRSAQDLRIPSAAYTPADYPIRPQPYFAVALTDRFWRPKVATNARVTIPFEIEKLERTRGRLPRQRARSRHPVAEDASQSGAAGACRGARSATEGAANAQQQRIRGRRDPLLHDGTARLARARGATAADALYAEFAERSAVFRRRARRDQLRAALSRHARQKHLDLAKHYLDIRGLENSVNRSRHNQSYMPVLEQSEAVGHAVNCARCMRVAGRGRRADGTRDGTSHAAERLWTTSSTGKCTSPAASARPATKGSASRTSLPTISAYAETCAVLMLITLNHRLFLATGDSRYVDVMERGMYNNALVGRGRERATASSTSIAWRARATVATRDGSTPRSNAARRTSSGSWPACRATSTPRTASDAVYVNFYVSSDSSLRRWRPNPFAVGDE